MDWIRISEGFWQEDRRGIRERHSTHMGRVLTKEKHEGKVGIYDFDFKRSSA